MRRCEYWISNREGSKMRRCEYWISNREGLFFFSNLLPLSLSGVSLVLKGLRFCKFEDEKLRVLDQQSRRFEDETLRVLESALVSKEVKSSIEVRSGLRQFLRSESLSVMREISEKSAEEKLLVLEFLVRSFVLVGDVEAAAEMDFRPSRMGVVAKHVEAFIREFFYQNPLSQVGLVTIKDGVAHCLTDLGGSPNSHVKAFMGKLECSGDSYLQNALDLVHGYLEQIPSYGHREVLILYSALSTCDPGDIMEYSQRLIFEPAKSQALQHQRERGRRLEKKNRPSRLLQKSNGVERLTELKVYCNFKAKINHYTCLIPIGGYTSWCTGYLQKFLIKGEVKVMNHEHMNQK